MNEELAKYQHLGDFPGGSVVKTSPSKAVRVGLIPGWEAGMPQGQKIKT